METATATKWSQRSHSVKHAASVEYQYGMMRKTACAMLKSSFYLAVPTQQIVDQLGVGRQRFRVCEDRVSAVLNLSQCIKVPQQDVTQPLGIDTGDLPLLGLLVLQPHRPEQTHKDHMTTLHPVDALGREDGLQGGGRATVCRELTGSHDTGLKMSALAPCGIQDGLKVLSWSWTIFFIPPDSIMLALLDPEGLTCSVWPFTHWVDFLLLVFQL